MTPKTWIGSLVLVAALAAGATALFVWKRNELAATRAAAANQPEPAESAVVVAVVERPWQRHSVAIGTIRAVRSVTLRNELAGTVAAVHMQPGQVVEQGALLVELDVSVEKAELEAQKAEADLAGAILRRREDAVAKRATSEIEVERARSERAVALARIDRIQAIIDRKTIRAPFRGRIGLTDVHPGQYLEQGSMLTTLQGVDETVHVDFAVGQDIARGLAPDAPVDLLVGEDGDEVVEARVVAVDARIDTSTRNMMVRVEAPRARVGLAPGGSVRVRVPLGRTRTVVAVPVDAVRRGPAGDHVFVVTSDDAGSMRAHTRAVTPLTMDDGQYLLAGGVEPGEKVASTGSFKLREGVLVVPKPVAEPTSTDR